MFVETLTTVEVFQRRSQMIFVEVTMRLPWICHLPDKYQLFIKHVPSIYPSIFKIYKIYQDVQNTKRRRGRPTRPGPEAPVFCVSWYLFVYLFYIWI